MKSKSAKKKARSVSKSGREPTRGTQLVCTSSQPLKAKEPTKLRVSPANEPQRGITRADLQDLSISFSTPQSIREFIYGHVSGICERDIRAEVTDETLVYKKLAQQLPFYLELTDATAIVKHLITFEDPLKAWLDFNVNFQLHKFRTSQAPLEKKPPRRDARKVKPNAPKKSSNDRNGKSRS